MTSVSESAAVRARSPCQRWASLLGALLLLSWNNSVRAQELDGTTRAAARDIAIQGAEAFDRGEYEMALDRFDRAASLVGAPSITVMQARCLVALGRWVEGLDRYHQTLQVTLPPDAPDAFRQAQSDAMAEATALEPRIPRLEIRIGPGKTVPADLTVTFDGAPVPAVLLNVERPVDPGAHTIDATSAGRRLLSKVIQLAEAEHQLFTVPIHTEVHAEQGGSSATAAPEANPLQTDGTPSTRLRWLKPVAFGVGAVGTAGAVFSGVQALDKKNELDASCDPGCPPQVADTLSSFRLHRTLFYVSAIVGTAGLGTGTYVLLSETSERPQIGLSFSPFGGEIRGTF